jgi:hypothetical protein
MTNRYQQARNVHANATTAMKYIQHYRYKKSTNFEYHGNLVPPKLRISLNSLNGIA